MSQEASAQKASGSTGQAGGGKMEQAKGKAEQAKNKAEQKAEKAEHNAEQKVKQAEHKAEQAAGKAGRKAREMGKKAGDEAASRLEQRKDRAAQGVHTVADALRIGADQMRAKGETEYTPYVDRLAKRVDRVSSFLEKKDVREMADEAERFARRNETVFLGGAFALGLMGARFLKSSGRDAARENLPVPREYYTAPAEPPVGEAEPYGEAEARGMRA